MDGNQKEEVREWRRGTKEVRKEVGGDVRALDGAQGAVSHQVRVRALDASFFALFLLTHLFFQFFVLHLFSVFLLPPTFFFFFILFFEDSCFDFSWSLSRKSQRERELFKNTNKKKQREHVKFRAK